MRIKFIISYGAGENKYEPKYVCPICSQVGLAFDPAEKSLKSYSQSCLCCGYHDNPMHPEYKETWYDSWLECGAEKLYEKPYEERREYYSRIVYADYAKYRYVLSDEEIEKHEFDEKIFTQYGFVSNSDSSKKSVLKAMTEEAGNSIIRPIRSSILMTRKSSLPLERSLIGADTFFSQVKI